jgi:hypothetical protein
MRSTPSLLVAIATIISGSTNNNNMAAALSTLSKPVSRIRNSSITPLLESSTVEKEKIGLPGMEQQGNLSPFLQEMVDEQRILQMNVGKAMDTLRSDYPYFLKRAPGKYSSKR